MGMPVLQDDDDIDETEVMPEVDLTVFTGPKITIEDTGISIGFAEHFKVQVEPYEFFPLNRKRNFLTRAPMIAASLGPLLQDQDFAMAYLLLRHRIAMPQGHEDHITEEQLAEAIRTELLTPNVVRIISEQVEAGYRADIDTNYGTRNEELQFTNRHARVIFKWSWATRVAIPLLGTFMDERDILAAKDFGRTIMDVFGACLKPFEEIEATNPEGPVDIMAKLRKLLESRVYQTRYSDKVMWMYLRNLAVNPAVFIDQQFRKLITDIIPKPDQGSNIISFLSTVIHNQIRYQFTAKFPYSYRPISMNTTEENGTPSLERIETDLIRRDEGGAIIAEVAGAEAIAMACAELEWHPSDEEIKHWAGKLHGKINVWQRGMIIKYFLPRVGDYRYILGRTLEEYAEMFAIVRRWLLVQGFDTLVDYFASAVEESQGDRRATTRKRFIKEFMDSQQYRELLTSTYSIAGQSVIDSGVIIENLNMLNGARFVTLASFEGDEGGGRVVEHRLEAVAQELLRFIAHIARSPS